MSKPKRIQRKRTKGWKMGDAVYVGRPSKWGNPFVIGVDGAAERCVSLFVESMHNLRRDHPEKFEELVAPLRGKDLCCWCGDDEPCHAHALLIIANSWEPAST